MCLTLEIINNVRLKQAPRIYLLSPTFRFCGYPTAILPIKPKEKLPSSFSPGNPQRRLARCRPPGQEASRTTRILPVRLLNSVHVSNRVACHTSPSHLAETPCIRGNTCDKDDSPRSGARSASKWLGHLGPAQRPL